MSKTINNKHDEMMRYENSLKYYRDMKNSLDTAKHEGRFEEKIEIAKKMKDKGFDYSMIVEMTGLTVSEINQL